jgi:excisionase family DNA binding protein
VRAEIVIIVWPNGEEDKFKLLWRSPDGRQIANRDACYELRSFNCQVATDNEALRTSLPAKIETGWIKNPDWQPLATQDVFTALERGYPPEQGINPGHQNLVIEPGVLPAGTTPETATQIWTRDLTLFEILNESLGPQCDNPEQFSYRRLTPVVRIFQATFGNGTVLYLKDVVKILLPSAAQLPPWPEYFNNRAEAAEYAGVTERTIANWMRDGLLKAKHLSGRIIRIDRSDLDETVHKCKRKS